MSVLAKALIQTKFADSAGATEYTAPSGKRTIIDKFTATNIDSGAVLITVNLIPSGESQTSSNTLTKAFSVAAGASVELPELKNHILAPGDAVFVLASVASKMVIRMSGRELS